MVRPGQDYPLPIGSILAFFDFFFLLRSNDRNKGDVDYAYMTSSARRYRIDVDVIIVQCSGNCVLPQQFRLSDGEALHITGIHEHKSLYCLLPYCTM